MNRTHRPKPKTLTIVSGSSHQMLCLAALCLGAWTMGSAAQAASRPEDIITITDATKLAWKDFPGMAGVQYVVLSGDPSKAGFYTIRAKFAPHVMSKPHWHPEARHVTVIKGTWWAGTGPVFDPASTSPVPAGGYAVHTPHEIHYDGSRDEEVIVQISGIGPSATVQVNPDGTDKK
jgi:hypothetical protein